MTLPPPDSPAPSRARSPLRSRIGRALAPHWGALLALTLFLIAGLIVIDDYGVATDEPLQRQTAEATLGYLANGDLDDFIAGLSHKHNKFYGMAFETPIYLVERGFGLEDSRGVWLFRHVLIHLLYLTGGFFAYLLARRLFGAQMFAIFAMLFFLLHPRLYAHSFFNSTDVPFLVAFVIALHLAHRALKRDTLWTFVLLGVGVGIAVNLRIMGVVLLAAIPAMRALDLAFASSWRERKRVILSTVAFALTSLLTIYALLPYLWADPIARAAEGWATLSDHPHKPYELFRGLLGRSVEFPEYITVWLSITSPPFALLLGLIGGALILFRAVKTPREALRSARLRFGLLLAGCFALPILAVALLEANVYHGWRQAHFLWAPFALLAAWGLHGLAATLSARRLRAAVCGAAGVGLAAALASMALIHPNQQVYFNFFVDRVTPEYLRTQYMMGYWNHHPTRQALEWLLERGASSSATTNLTGYDFIVSNLSLLPDKSREKFAWEPSLDALTINYGQGSRPDLAAHQVRVYGNTVMTVERKGDLRAVYEATLGRAPILNAAFDVYRLNGALALAMKPCAPAYIENVGVTLRVTPVDPGDLPPWREGKREDTPYFHLAEYGAFFDAKCIALLPLPDYPIADFSVVPRPKLLERAAARESMRRAQEDERLLARSAYDLYLADNELVYVQEGCDPLETEHPFRVSVFPDRASDLPEEWRERGHERFWFDFYEYGALLEEGACVALFPLPDYPVAGIRTAQYIEGGDDLWEAAFSSNPERYRTAYRAVAGREPLARGAFDLYLLDGDLVYVNESCEQADTEARFFLHIVPERAGDLPEARQEWGFDNLDFRFFLNGAWFDAQCAARVSLPPYPIASVRTGQYVSGAGEIWRAEFAVRR